jgi:hypothetical protein
VEDTVPDDAPVCLLRDCDEPAVMHIRHADEGYRGERFCSWEHLLEYAHAVAHHEAGATVEPSPPGAVDDVLWSMVTNHRAEHFLG